LEPFQKPEDNAYSMRVLGITVNFRIGPAKDDPRLMLLYSIKADGTGFGAGTATMNYLCQCADLTGMFIKLQPVPLPESGTPVQRLIDFYLRFGFEVLPGAPSLDLVQMVRKPCVYPYHPSIISSLPQEVQDDLKRQATNFAEVCQSGTPDPTTTALNRGHFYQFADAYVEALVQARLLR